MKAKITFEIAEAADQCGINQDIILQFINDDWIKPLDSKNLLFDEEDLARIQLIAELKEDLGVNDESVPIILHLIDQLNQLHLNLMENKDFFQ